MTIYRNFIFKVCHLVVTVEIPTSIIDTDKYKFLHYLKHNLYTQLHLKYSKIISGAVRPVKNAMHTSCFLVK